MTCPEKRYILHVVCIRVLVLGLQAEPHAELLRHDHNLGNEISEPRITQTGKEYQKTCATDLETQSRIRYIIASVFAAGSAQLVY